MIGRLRVAATCAAALGLLAAAARKAPRFAFHTSPASALAFRNVSGDPDQIPILDQNGQGLCAIDFDGDGLLDLYLVNGSTLGRMATDDNPGSALFRNNGDGTFTDVTKRAGVPGPRWGTGCAVADFDGDGREDLFVAGWGGNRLYRNRGDGTFEDVTERAGVGDGRWCSSGAWSDLDGDGRLDLVVSRYVRFDPKEIPTTESGKPCTYRGVVTGCPPYDYPGETMVIYRNLGGRFEDVSAAAGIEKARPSRGFGVAALPLFDDSKLPDIYIGCDVAENLLFHGVSALRYEESAAERGAAVNFEGKHESGMGLVVGDLSESGRPDLFLTNFAGEKNALYRNGGESFSDVTIGTGLDAHRGELGWGDSIGDFDNDGHEDVVIANGQIYPQVEQLRDPVDAYAQPIRLFAGEGRDRFTEISSPALANRRSRRGLVAADLNNDGRIDLVTQTHTGTPEIFWNDSAPSNHWIRFSLRGRSEPSASGARVTVRFAERTRTAWKLPNQGYQSSQDPRVHFGLSAARRVDGVSIRWPDGTVQEIGELAADADYEVAEGSPPIRSTPPRFGAPNFEPGRRSGTKRASPAGADR